MAIAYRLREVPARLLPAGPWVTDHISGTLWMGTRHDYPSPDALGPWLPGVDGVWYATLRDLPTLAALRRPVLPDLLTTVDLLGLGPTPISPACGDGLALGLDGTPDWTRPGSPYARLSRLVADRLAEDADAVGAGDPQVMALALAALQTTHRITQELAVAMGVLTTRTVWQLAEASWAIPKA